MLNNFKKQENPLNPEIDRLLDILGSLDPESESYQKITDRLTQLVNAAKETKGKDIDWTPLIVAGINAGVSIITILLILNFEKLDILTSRAFGIFAKKLV
jgi:hypothetical protein